MTEVTTMKVYVEKCFWAFHTKKCSWFLSDCYGKVTKDRHGLWVKTPSGLIRFNPYLHKVSRTYSKKKTKENLT